MNPKTGVFPHPINFPYYVSKTLLSGLKGMFLAQEFPKVWIFKDRFEILRNPFSYSSFIYSFVVYFGLPQFFNPKGKTVGLLTNFPHFSFKIVKAASFYMYT